MLFEITPLVVFPDNFRRQKMTKIKAKYSFNKPKGELKMLLKVNQLQECSVKDIALNDLGTMVV